MASKNNVQINLAIPERYRNLLGRMAAEQVLEHPGQIVTREMLPAALKVVIVRRARE